MSVTLFLVGFSVLCALAAIIAGLTAPRSWVWDWADAVYYPIAIVGVVFLFVSAERSRSLDALRRGVEQAEKRITIHETTKPEFNAGNFQTAFLGTSYGLLMTEADLGEACAKIPDFNIRCISARDHAQIIHSIFDGLYVPKTPVQDTKAAEIIKEYCERGYRLIDALQTKMLRRLHIRGAEEFIRPVIEKKPVSNGLGYDRQSANRV